MKLIPDSELKKIPIKDNGEKLINIQKFCPKIIVRPPTYIKNEGEWYAKRAGFVRETVANKLCFVQKNLPEGYKILLRCGYRSLKSQKKAFQAACDEVKKENPIWNKNKIKQEASKAAAPLDIVPPHSTGGAVDVSILNSKGRLLDMGTKLGEFKTKTATNSREISKKAQENRKLLIKLMKKAGFINYPTEWWHWSYGDRYWAAVLKKKYSIYKGV